MVVDGDDAACALKEGAFDGEQTHRPATPAGDGVAALDLAVLRGHPTRREDVGQEKHLLVFDAVRNLDRPVVRIGHACV